MEVEGKGGGGMGEGVEGCNVDDHTSWDISFSVTSARALS